jgi:glycosyltransferase involved in cell wall biosynthesis
MHIVPVCNSVVRGGAEIYLQRLYPRLQARGQEITLLGEVPAWPLASRRVDLGPKWGKKTIAQGLVRLRHERRNVDLAAFDVGADIFHAQFKREQIGLTETLARHAPVVWTEHGVLPAGVWGAGLRAAYRAASTDVRGIFCVSEAVAQDVSSVVGDRTDIWIVENAVDTKLFRPPTPDERASARAALGVRDEPVLLWAGRLAPSKLPLLAVDVGRQFDGTMLLVGEGPMREDLPHDANGVRILGFRENLVPMYHAADAFLFTSDGTGEAMRPYSVIEASACGLPVLANTSCGLEALVDEMGLVLAEGAEALAATARHLTNTSRSPQGRDWAMRNDIELWADTHLAKMMLAASL